MKLAGDFNGDGKLDIAIGGQNGPLVWYINPGWQKVHVAERGWKTVGGAVGDIDGDGDVDIAAGAQVWFENPRSKGDPAKDAWQAHRISDVGSHDVALVDLDRDGKLDLVARDQSSFGHKSGNKIHFWRQAGPDQWSHHGVDCPHGEGLAVLDLDRDGDTDVVIGGRWFENNGRVNGTWREHVFTTHWAWADTKVALGDLNGDGFVDVVLAPAELQGQHYRLVWYEAPVQTTRSNWQEHVVAAPLEAVMHGLAVDDMDGDGRPDIVASCMHQGAAPQEVSIHLNTGEGTRWRKVVVSERGSHDILVADFNQDGRPDILGANHGGPLHPVELWLNQAAKRTAAGPLRVHPTNSRYFTDGTTNLDGSLRAVYLTGSHTWNSLQDVTGQEWFLPNLISTQNFAAYLDFLVAHYHNFIRLWIVEHAWNAGSGARIAPHPWLRTGPGNALDGRPRFDLSKYDPAYFERLRSRVIAARDRGLYVSVMLFGGMWGTEHKGTWKGHPFNADNNVNGVDGDLDHDGQGNELYTLRLPRALALQKATAMKVVETLNDLDNVLYEVANEVREYSTPWQHEIIQHVKAVEARMPKQHPVGMTGYNSIPHEDLLKSRADWISPSNSGGDYRNNPPAADGRKIILIDTDHLWGEGGNPDWVWKSFTRGLHPIWMERIKVAAGDLPQAEAIRKAMGQTRRLAERVNLAALVPHPELASTGYCLARPEQEYVVYLPEGGEVTVNLSAVSGTLAVEWIHPVDGTMTPRGSIEGAVRRRLKAPFSGAAAAYLKAQNRKSL